MLRKRIILPIIFLGLLAVVILIPPFLIHFGAVEATATIQIRSVRPSFLAENHEQINYDEFVNTQIALLRSPIVLDRVLQTPEVAKLPMVIKQKDRRAWLQKKLRIKRDGNSEIVTVSIVTRSQDNASEKIVNAVMDCYLEFIDESQRHFDVTLRTQLQGERQRLYVQAQQLQNTIRLVTQQAAGQGAAEAIETRVSEILSQEIALTEVALLTLQAERAAVVEQMMTPAQVPISLLLQLVPIVSEREKSLQDLNAKKKTLQNQKEVHAQHLVLDENQILEQIDQKIKAVDEEIQKIVAVDDNAVQAVKDALRSQAEMELYALDQKIRTKEFVLKTLTTKYNEQQVENAERAMATLDATFDKAQLDRTNRTLAQIDDRILAIRSEQRAPGQITPLSRAVSSPKRGWW